MVYPVCRMYTMVGRVVYTPGYTGRHIGGIHPGIYHPMYTLGIHPTVHPMYTPRYTSYTHPGVYTWYTPWVHRLRRVVPVLPVNVVELEARSMPVLPKNEEGERHNEAQQSHLSVRNVQDPR